MPGYPRACHCGMGESRLIFPSLYVLPAAVVWRAEGAETALDTATAGLGPVQAPVLGVVCVFKKDHGCAGVVWENGVLVAPEGDGAPRPETYPCELVPDVGGPEPMR